MGTPVIEKKFPYKKGVDTRWEGRKVEGKKQKGS